MPTVSGTVDYRGEPLEGAIVALNRSFTTTDAFGRFQLEAAVGRYMLKVMHRLFPTVRRAVDVTEDISVEISV